VTGITDSIGNNVVQRYDYDSFGNIVSMLDPNFKQPYTYTSREYDEETGLYYYRARYYDSTTGRFVNEDPIGFKGGINQFAYVGNNPVNRFDPLGLTWLDYDSSTGTLTVHPGGMIDEYGPGLSYPAGNNAQRGSRGPLAPGTYPYSYYVPHDSESTNGPFGPNGNLVLNVPGCVGCGVHAGRRDSCDRAGRCGVNHATNGCIRTTDEAMEEILTRHQNGDPLLYLHVR
jgi:RHS repeat-associated protein